MVRKECKMNISSIGVNAFRKVQSFKGNQNEEFDANAIKNSIEANTEALNKLADSAKLIADTIYAVEKSKTSTNSFREKCFGETETAAGLVKFANYYWQKAQH